MIKLISLHGQDYVPVYATEGAAGADLRAYIEEGTRILKAGSAGLFETGLFTEFPVDRHLQIVSRSGLALKGLVVGNSPGIIDSDYRGEIKVILRNLTNDDFIISDKDRIAQLVVVQHLKAEFIIANDLTDTNRGSGGFGSTGTGQIVS